MNKGHTKEQSSTTAQMFKGTIRILAASFLLAQSTGHYLDPMNLGTGLDIAYVTVLGVVGFALMFAINPANWIAATEEPDPISCRTPPPVIADPISRNVFEPMSWLEGADTSELIDDIDCDVVNIFVEPRRQAHVEMVAA